MAKERAEQGMEKCERAFMGIRAMFDVWGTYKVRRGNRGV